MILNYSLLFLLFITASSFGDDNLIFSTKSVRIWKGYKSITQTFKFPSTQVKSLMIYASGQDVNLRVPSDNAEVKIDDQYSQMIIVPNQTDKYLNAIVTGKDEIILVVQFEYEEAIFDIQRRGFSKIDNAYEFGKNLYVKENSVVHLPCPLLEDEENINKAESIKWIYTKDNYKTLISAESDGSLKVNVSDTEHSGSYSCSLQFNSDYIYTVEVVKAPYFLNKTEPTEYVGEPQKLTCKLESDILPVPKIEWYIYGRLIEDNKELNYKINRWGNYTCRFRNFFGQSDKEFTVTSNGCLIEERNDPSYPFIVKSDEVIKKKHGLFVNKGQEIKMFCSPYENHFKQIPENNEIEAVCVKEFLFTINGKNYDVTDLRCSADNTPVAKIDNRTCLDDSRNTNSISNSYTSAHHLNEIYSICYYEDTKQVVYAKTYLDLYYDVNNHTENDKKCSQTNGSFINLDDSSAMTKIVEEEHVSLDFTIWHKCKREVEFNDLVKKIRKHEHSLLVWTGTFQKYDSYTISNDIPLYIWKVVKDLENQDMVAIIYINQAYPDPTNEPYFTKCDCKGFLDISDVVDHQLFCTTVNEDFASKIKIPLSTFTLQK